MGAIHTVLREQGKNAALKANFDRSVVEAAARYLASEDQEIAFLFSGWTQSTWPHRRLPDDALWEVVTDWVTLTIRPAHRIRRDGTRSFIGVPYGSRARLIMLFLQSEALRTGQREIELGGSLHSWLRRLDIPVGGKAVAAVRDQSLRISRCQISFCNRLDGSGDFIDQSLLDGDLIVDDGTEHSGALAEKATLSDSFFEQLRRNPVRIGQAAVRQLANNSLALDVYCWLSSRLHILNAAVTVSWGTLHSQYGRGVAREDHFRDHFRVALQLALSVYPEARVESVSGGLRLLPSRPPVDG
jgi:Plasmid encoded RepA protein